MSATDDIMHGRRQDLIPPCAKGCPERTQTCRDSCQREEYLAWLELKAMKRDDTTYRRTAASIDKHRSIRNQKAAQYRKKGR